ncbi:MAG: formate C-acetyltransferase [Tenericutes bacterium GWC2_34_14]|nr:MAG: formate C-acetyltransferase [Tenericutes bacterium GWA2_35_7]OHE29865.1 MAG: formate C-acetyltransferase [Tenericutes bacterium GWC2_34_14]OHE34844.1 MAG: formate C-acetyltransferase [Tenericutes bacterium GWE2_34_108]OHE37295.1 MAG: formate C-acetyltransferase [Tenericutes bacterium GWF1_35_14]OHE39572.1 MAG: formate C-acetyltransferase [Tenericutes bacterium GWF2_35_184]OHE43160.1 MAG: formate C-acetyltransferase [Tenericutes bacterium RIFOXYA12_FULL_35_10]OHE44239.1 MAG: formate C-
MSYWRGFKEGSWMKEINVRDFMNQNYTEYLGTSSFLTGSTESSLVLNKRIFDLLEEEKQKGGVIELDTDVVASITSHNAGYINKSLEKIVGLQTDKPFKRAFHPYGGIQVATKAAEAYGYHISDNLKHVFTEYRKTHNQGVFDVYNGDIRKARRSAIITGLPDGYGRGRIIGDYRRVALYGVDFLIEQKKLEKTRYSYPMNERNIRLREEIQEQINALTDLKTLGTIYGFDLSRPAANATEAIQWLYLGYLAAVKEQNGAAMSLGRTATFLDIYIERDLAEGILTELEAQELIDHFIMKLRMVRFARTPEYNELFTGDPTWVTESLAGMNLDGRSWVTKTTYRYLQTLYNLGTSAEPNLTVLWSDRLPENFKKFCAKVSIDTSSIQYENDEQMRPNHTDDYAIACCVSPMTLGKEMQFFGARANIAKALLYALNDGKDEITGDQVGPRIGEVTSEYLEFDDVMKKFDTMLDWLAKTYVSALNAIHYMHDKYAYERLQMALHDAEVIRNFATGIAGLSVVADSLSAIKYAKVKPIYNENHLITDFETTGEFPFYGNNDDRVDHLAVDIVKSFMDKIRSQYTYRESVPTMSILTITSNVVYGKKTGNTPDGRKYGEAFAPGANPMHGRDKSGALKSLLSVSKIPCESCQDGISNTFTLIPDALGKEHHVDGEDNFVYEGNLKIDNLVGILDGYFMSGGYHLNVNIFNRDMLVDAYNHPDKYPNLTIRVSGYAVNFSNLTNEQKREVISRTFHESI